MKNVFFSILIVTGFVFSSIVAVGGTDDNLKVKSQKKSVNGKVQKVNNKIYFNLKVNEDSEKGFYVLFKSFDENNSIPISVKEAIITTTNVPILYSFIEENIPLRDTHYEIVKISEKGKYTVLDFDYTSEATVSSEEN